MTDDVESLKSEWLETKKTLNSAKAREIELRRKIFDILFSDSPGVTQKNEELGLRGKIPLYYTVDEAAYQAMLPDLREKGIPDHLVKYKASVDLKTLKLLPQHKVAALSECITMKPGLCSLEVI